MNVRYGDLLIREVVPADAEQLCAWWNDGAVMAHAGFPNGLGRTVDQIRQQILSPRGQGLHMILLQDVPIGEMNYRNAGDDACEIGIKICDASQQNKGLGKIILSLFIRTLFEECGFRKILLDTNLTNTRAQHVYEQLGFRKLRVNVDSWTDQLGRLQSAVDYELTPGDFVSFI